MKDNIINLFNDGKEEIKETINTVINDAIQDTIDFDIVNCMIVMIDDDDTITYSYANFNKKVTMIGALETLKALYIKDGNIDKGN